ncbi:MAG: sensor histidine kinase [Ruminococcus sp.]|nr:sensor histidine kinase [Ruminococcus sp.]
MKFFKAYLKEKRIVILTFLLFSLIFSISFFLFRLPIEAVLYPTVLCVLLGIVIIIIDYIKMKAKHNELLRIQSLTADMITYFPKTDSIYEDDYNEILKKLKTEVSNLEHYTSTKYNDMIDYYTIWAHQIKTPIASMRLTLQNDDSTLSRTIISDLFRIEQYVEMVLAFLRLDSESSDYVFKEYNIDNIIKKSVKKFSSEFINRKISLDFKPCDFKIITDEKWFAFVIEQLLSNALKYTKKGTIKICMPQFGILCIEDTGIGISNEDLPRIFERGYTGYNGRCDTHSSGLGLYLCKRICNNLSIDIKVESKPDKGSKIFLDLSQHKIKYE